MDFLRIRQKARERTRSPAGPPAGLTPPALLPASSGAEAAPDALATIEDTLRAELHAPAAPEAWPAAARAPDESRAAAVPEEPLDPLDDFFWHADEVAPLLPDLLAASALPHADPPEVRREWLTFQLGSEEYGLDIQHIQEILKAPALTEVPRAPADVLGVIMVRGEVIAVFDPRRRLGLPPGEPGRKARVLVCDSGDGPRGLLVDSVSNVVRLTPSSIEARPANIGGASAEYIAGIGRDRSRLFVLLDVAKLLADRSPAPAGEALA